MCGSPGQSQGGAARSHTLTCSQDALGLRIAKFCSLDEVDRAHGLVFRHGHPFHQEQVLCMSGGEKRQSSASRGSPAGGRAEKSACGQQAPKREDSVFFAHWQSFLSLPSVHIHCSRGRCGPPPALVTHHPELPQLENPHLRPQPASQPPSFRLLTPHATETRLFLSFLYPSQVHVTPLAGPPVLRQCLKH